MSKTTLVVVLLAIVVVVYFFIRGRYLPQGTPDISAPVGDTIQFGNLDWLILEVDGDKVFILSKRILGGRPYHSGGSGSTWENSTLREFLNGAFYENTFSEKEKERIIETELVNRGQGITSGGNNTVDKVFLLSIDEVNKYMGNAGHPNIRNARQTNSWWWLRSPGGLGDGAAAKIAAPGSRQAYFVEAYGGIRPALWITLEDE